MKATLEFNLPDDRSEHELAIAGPKLLSVLWELDQWLRARVKYEDHKFATPDEALEAARAQLREGCLNQGIDLDALGN